MKNSLSADDYEQDTILEALGLSINAGIECDDDEYMTEIAEVQPGSAADTDGQLLAGKRDDSEWGEGEGNDSFFVQAIEYSNGMGRR